MEDSFGSSGHKMIINDRKSMAISGVKDVVSFDAQEIILETQCGLLLIKGDQLHINHLTLEKGQVNVDGTIDGLTYSDTGNSEKKTGHFLGRLFG